MDLGAVQRPTGPGVSWCGSVVLEGYNATALSLRGSVVREIVWVWAQRSCFGD